MSYGELKDQRANSVDPDEVAHYDPPHLNLRCLQLQLFSVLHFTGKMPVNNLQFLKSQLDFLSLSVGVVLDDIPAKLCLKCIGSLSMEVMVQFLFRLLF